MFYFSSHRCGLNLRLGTMPGLAVLTPTQQISTCIMRHHNAGSRA